MDRISRKIIELLRNNEFLEIDYRLSTFEIESKVFAKEIKENIFLLFVITMIENVEKIRAIIAHFDSLESIGNKEPIQIMFHLSIKEKKDLQYLDQYLKVTSNA